jgi:hypothetical protein
MLHEQPFLLNSIAGLSGLYQVKIAVANRKMDSIQWVDLLPPGGAQGVDKAWALLTPCMPPMGTLWRPCYPWCCPPVIYALLRCC